MRVAFFQRVFAHYQAGLMKALSVSPVHEYKFFGSDRDPLWSGIEPVSESMIRMLPYTVCKTTHWGAHCAFQWKAIDVALRGAYDAIILEGGATILTNWPAILLARLRGIRVLLYTHGWLRPEQGFRRVVKNFFYRLAHGLLLYGPRGRAFGLHYGFDPERLYVAFNSLDDEVIRRQRESMTTAMSTKFLCDWFGIHAALPMIVSVGRLNMVKEYPLLLEAAAILKDQYGIEANILLVGEGSERPVLVEQAIELGVRLAMAGAQYDEELLSRAISSAAMMVIPGAAGLSVVHSLSYGTPVVVHGTINEQGPEVEAVRDGINGAHFKQGDAGDLARAMRDVLTMLPKSPEVEGQCRSIVDEAYSPGKMGTVFDAAVSGIPARPVRPPASH